MTQMSKKCLDTYALWELILGNPKFAFLLNQPYVITNWTLIEFYKTLLQRFDKSTARMWYERFKPLTEDVHMETAIKAVEFQHDSKKEDMSLFDCMGYIFSLENDYDFVTGDKAFKDKKGVLFIQK